MHETLGEIELVAKHAPRKKKKKERGKTSETKWQRRGLQLSGFGRALSPSLLLQRRTARWKNVVNAATALVSVRLWELMSRRLPCVNPSKVPLNEINKLRLDWQPASKVITLSLMSPRWNGRRLGLNGNTAGCGQAVFFQHKEVTSDGSQSLLV